MDVAFFKLFSIRFFGLGLTFATIFFIKVNLGIESVGLYYIYLNTIILSGSLATIGLTSLVQKRYAAQNTSNGYLRIILRDISSRIWLIFCLGFGSVLILLKFGSFTELLSVVIVSLLYCFSSIFFEIIRFSLNAKISELARNIVRPSVFLSLVSLGNPIIVSLAFSFLVEFLVTTIVAFRRYKFSENVKWKRDTEGFNLFVINSIVIIFAQIDILVLSKILSIEALGVFATVNRYAFLMSVGLYVGNLILIKHVNNLFKTEDRKHMDRYLSELVRLRYFYLIFMVSLLAGLEFYLRLFSIIDNSAYFYFLVISISFLLQAMMGPINVFFINLNMTSFLLFTNIILFALFGGFYYLYFNQAHPLSVLMIIYSFPVIGKLVPYAYFQLYLRKNYEY